MAQKTRGGGALIWQWRYILRETAETSWGRMATAMDAGGIGTVTEEATSMDLAAAPAA